MRFLSNARAPRQGDSDEMIALGVGVRLALQAFTFLVMAPIQLLAARHGWALAGWLPVWFHRLFLKLFGVRVVVRGRPPEGGATLVLSNHVSWLDIPVLASLRPLSFVAKSEVAGWPVVGLFARLQRSVFIDRARKSHTASVNTEVAHRLARGDVIVLFPEGTTGDGNRVLPFRSALVGAARAALAEPSLLRINLHPVAVAYVRRNGLPVTRRTAVDRLVRGHGPCSSSRRIRARGSSRCRRALGRTDSVRRGERPQARHGSGGSGGA
jgi:1-acyl-sn-glycerol-3-phosphate acyltransferase